MPGETKEIAPYIHVPENCKTLKEAVERVHGDDGLTTIVVGAGEHQIDGIYLEVSSAMNIVGDPGVPRSGIVVVGGIKINEDIEGNCHLQHLTLRQAKATGVYAASSFTMEDVLVEQCDHDGVFVVGTNTVGRCTNVEVHRCKESGMIVLEGGSIILSGPKTMVSHNCTKGFDSTYGLKVFGNINNIRIEYPLTKEKVSKNNKGGGDWSPNFDKPDPQPGGQSTSENWQGVERLLRF